MFLTHTHTFQQILMNVIFIEEQLQLVLKYLSINKHIHIKLSLKITVLI